MVPSLLIYTGVLIVCCLTALLADKWNSKGLVWVIIAVMTLLSGLRAVTVGIDTASYVSKFQLIAEGKLGLAYGLEDSFKYLCFICLKITNSPTAMLAILALITNACMVCRFWELRKISSFPCMVACFYMAFYFASMNCIRQFCAVAVVFYAARYLNQKKIARYILGVLAAMIFHQTAIVGVVPVLLAAVRWKEYSRNQRLFYLFGVIALPAVLLIGFTVLRRYLKYFSNVSIDFGMMTAVKLVFFAATVFFAFVAQRGKYFPWDLQHITGSDRFSLILSGSCYFLGLCLSVLGYIFPYADRIGWYFFVYEGVYLGVLLKAKKRQNAVFFGVCGLTLIGYGFVYSMLHNSQGTMPYLFFWQ